jgi:hypothetical protein
MTLSRGEVVMEETKMSSSAGAAGSRSATAPSRPSAQNPDRSLDLH